MTSQSKDPGKILDQALAEMRRANPPEEAAEHAAARVVENLKRDHHKVVPIPPRISGCDGFQTLLPAYLSSSLTPSRRLLLEDHLKECANCRRAKDRLMAAASGRPTPRPATPARRNRGLSPRWRTVAAVAAGLVVVWTLSQIEAVRDWIQPIEIYAVANTVDGNLYRISGQNIRPIAAGERIERFESVRTGIDSGAVLQLADGSRIEMAPRSELSLTRALDGVRIELQRGNIIVSAADQRDGHLYVRTADCTVTVVGTVFAVNAGAKGSRVSVIEGNVTVEYGEGEEALTPGEQVATSFLLGTVPVEQEIAWSREADTHIALLREVIAAAGDLGRRLEQIELRHTSNLVPLVPAGTLIFAALPNISQPVSESYALFKQRIADNPALAAWWQENLGPDGDDIGLDELMGRATRVGSYLGPEVVVAVPANTDSGAPVLMAEVTQPGQLWAAIEDDRQRVHSLSDGEAELILVGAPAELAAVPDDAGPVIYMDGAIMIASPHARAVRNVLQYRSAPASNPFASTELYQRLAQAYTEGVGWIFAADLQQVPADDDFNDTPLADARQLLFEQKTGSGGSAYQATMVFGQERRGLASWLSAPSAMGALDFVSPDAYAVGAFVSKDPALIVDDIFEILQQRGGLAEIEDFQLEHHIDIRYDLAEPLGNEFLLALDGPVLPTPSWKLVVEVNDAARLQNSFQAAVTEINRERAMDGLQPVVLTAESEGGQTYYAIAAEGETLVHYTFWAGYLIAGPNRVLLQEAIQYRNNGNSLGRSERFRAQLPADGHASLSGVLYQNFQAVAAALPVTGLQEVVGNSLPTVVCVYGYPDRIQMASRGIISSDIITAAGLTGILAAVGVH